MFRLLAGVIGNILLIIKLPELVLSNPDQGSMRWVIMGAIAAAGLVSVIPVIFGKRWDARLEAIALLAFPAFVLFGVLMRAIG
jgi:hypothetical protein